MIFEPTILALAFTCGFLVSLGIRFLLHRTDLLHKWKRTCPLDAKPTTNCSDEKNLAMINNVFPRPGNIPVNLPQGPPPPFGFMPVPQPMPSAFGIPNFGPTPSPYCGESFGSYRRVHQQLNRGNMWEASPPEAPNNLPFAFTVYYRHRPPRCVPSTELAVEIHCEGLKKVLKNCLQNVDSIFDPTPMV